MIETRTPAQDLAAIDRVVDLALAVDLITEEFAETLDRLRAPIAAEQTHRRALGRALAEEWHWDREAQETLDRSTDRVLAAIASVGAGIRWPIPEPPEGEDQPAGDATAPETVGVETAPEPTYMELMREALVERCNKNPWCAREGEHGGECAFFASAPHPTARAQILAEVAAYRWDDRVPGGAGPTGLIDSACNLARRAADVGPGGDPHRVSLIAAASMLVLAVERVDGGR